MGVAAKPLGVQGLNAQKMWKKDKHLSPNGRLLLPDLLAPPTGGEENTSHSLQAGVKNNLYFNTNDFGGKTMAKAIHTQVIEDKELEVTHAGQDVIFEVAEYLDGLTHEILMDEPLMVEWARSEGVLLGLLHAGLRDDVIKQRAIPRKFDRDKKAVYIDDVKHKEYQEIIREHKPPLIVKPGTGGGTKKGLQHHDIAKAMLEQGIPTGMVETTLVTMGMDARAAKTLVNDLAVD